MSHYNVKPLRLVLKPSRQLLYALSFVGIAALVILCCMPLAAWITLAGGFAITLSAAYFIVRDGLLLLPWSWQAIELDTKGELFFTSKDGTRINASVEGTSFVAAYMTLLNIQPAGSRWSRHIVILSDSAEQEEFRKFRVWLRWGMPLEYGEPVTEES